MTTDALAGVDPGGESHSHGDTTIRPSARHHGHLWQLLDGTPAHAPPGRLTLDDDGRVACHLCGRWFEHLGLHLRRHGWDADRYRAAVGLALHRPLCSATLSARITRRQQQRWRDEPVFRRSFEAGQDAARTGDLGALGAAVVRARRAAGGEPPEVTRVTSNALDRGRVTLEAGRRQRRELVIAASGYRSLHEYLRGEHAAGASLHSLATTTGLGRARLRAELDAAGVERRPTGLNRLESKQARATRNEAAAAARLGVDDLRAWLRSQRELGTPVLELARLVGHSAPWVRARITA